MNNNQMNDDIFQSYIERTKHIYASLGEEEIIRRNKEYMRKGADSYRLFVEAFSKGQCSLCGSPLKTFSVSKKPCLHWLLRLSGEPDKDKFIALLGQFGYFKMAGYLRWVANLDAPFKNINDLKFKSGKGQEKIIETTIRYKHLEWSFTCSNSDLHGHGEHNYPHFHFQMRLNKQSFIKYNDTHVPFSKEDVWRLSMLSQNEIPYSHTFRHGEGMEALFNEISPEILVEISQPSKNEAEATLSLDTLVHVKSGNTLTVDDLLKIIQESNSTGMSITQLADKLDVDGTTIISPGPRVPDLAKRNGRGKNL